MTTRTLSSGTRTDSGAAGRTGVGATTFPIEPVLRLLRARADRDGLSLTELVAVLPLPARTVFGWLARGSLRWDSADRMAVALGQHPAQIWPDWFTFTTPD